jgi:hypothetical protein
LLLNPKSLKPLPSLLFLAPAGPFVFWGIRENSEIRIEQRAGKMVLGILGALLGVLLRRGGTWSGSRRNLFGGPGAAAISCRASPGPSTHARTHHPGRDRKKQTHKMIDFPVRDPPTTTNRALGVSDCPRDQGGQVGALSSAAASYVRKKGAYAHVRI